MTINVLLGEQPQRHGEPRTIAHFRVSVQKNARGDRQLLDGEITISSDKDGYTPSHDFPGVPAPLQAEFESEVRRYNKVIARRAPTRR